MTEKLERVLEQSFLDYSAYVIQRRAIPDARDMMKYTARQILHAQAREKLDHKHPFKKSQKSVAAATSFSYVHGDASAYEQIVRMGRPLVQRYAFETINGNGGTPANSSDYSAPRYTEARLSELAAQVFEYINMNTIDAKDWEPTYDEEGVFPTVLPSVGFYNICNGSFGSIAPTMISSVPQFNLREVNEMIIKLIDDPDATVELLPDFASSGILLNPKTTLESLSMGEGKSALVRGKVTRGKDDNGPYIEVIELPYGVYTNTVCVELEKALEDKGVPFTEFKDLSVRAVRIRIYTKTPDAAEAWIYKNTSVQKHFTIKMIMLDNGKTPKLFTIKEALQAHIAHASDVFRKQYLFQLEQLKAREEIIRGLLKAYSILDKVIETIRGSSGRVDAINLLISKFDFTRPQAEAIADLRLHRLSTMDIKALENELETNLSAQKDIDEILCTREKFNLHLKAIYAEVASKFGDKRRTKIYADDTWETGQDGGKPTKDFWLKPESDGYTSTYIDEMGDEICGSKVDLTDDVLFITNQCRGFRRAASELPIGENKYADVLKLNKDEEVISVLQASIFDTHDFITLVGENFQKKVHKSFILSGSTQRGKRILPKAATLTGTFLC